MGLLDDRVALVTGGSSGIGRAAALAFAREGASVAVASRGAERGREVVQQIEKAGGDAIFLQTDVANSQEVQELVARTVSCFGRLDCALNSAAAYSGMHSRTSDFTEAEFDKTIGVSLKGVWLCMKFELQQMLSQDPPGGVIVNVSSVNGIAGSGSAAIYSAAKAGILALTKSAALEYAKYGIRVNALVPGAFRTPMLQWGFEHVAGHDPEAVQMFEEQMASSIPLGRIGVPNEAAQAVIWLCSDASSYVTGHSMIVDGGLSAGIR